jgi:hypothetical protein
MEFHHHPQANTSGFGIPDLFVFNSKLNLFLVLLLEEYSIGSQ